LLLLQASRPAYAVEDHGSGPDAAFVQQIDALLADPGMKGGIQGVVIQSLADGKTWYERNADLLLLPASNQKLLTSAAALDALGPDWTYATTLHRYGSLDDNGTLHGSLTLKGSGDPLLEAKDLDLFAESVKAAGIRKVQGKLIGDDSRFDEKRLGFGWEWDDLPFYYSAQVSGINLNENVVMVTVDPGRKPGDPLIARVTPADRAIKLVVRGRTAEKGQPSSLAVTRTTGVNQIVVDGLLAVDSRAEDRKPIPVSVEDPTRYALTYLQQKLKDAGIEVTGGIDEGILPDRDTVEIARHTGPPLSEVLKKLNKPSDNLVAECLLKTIGAEKGKAGVGSTAAGRDVAMQWFQIIGIDPAGISMQDGCGLSRHNFVSARSIALLLKAMHSHPSGKVFLDSLPVAGVDGTLRNRMKGTLATQNCRAKTGTMDAVSSLSGYVTTKAGEPLLFVMLMNNHRAPSALPAAVQNKIVELLAGYEKQP
jgi:serine-type D-Ala-D-Ala carboxypeptidase/endopeptidase (penicillin-binding protein 4)